MPKSENIFDLIYSDIFGLLRHKSLANSKYIIIFIDDYSRYLKYLLF